MTETKGIDFRDLFDEKEIYKREWDETDDEELSFEEEHKWDGLDPGFSSWQDYYNYLYG